MLGNLLENIKKEYIDTFCDGKELYAQAIIAYFQMKKLEGEEIPSQLMNILTMPFREIQPSDSSSGYTELWGNSIGTRFLGKDHTGNYVDIRFEQTQAERRHIKKHQEELAQEGVLHFKHPCKNPPTLITIFPYTVILDDNSVRSGYISTTFITD
ncbi:MAG: hypothetical protein AB9915_00470 [Candidatus Dojkabacteria bacterium]